MSFILDYLELTEAFDFCLPICLRKNQVEIDRLGTHSRVIPPRIKIPDNLRCELLWPSHIPHLSLEGPRGDGPGDDETVGPLVRATIMLFPAINMTLGTCCAFRVSTVCWGASFGHGWEVLCKVPPVSAPDQPDCWYGASCKTRRCADHAAQCNVSGLFDELRLPVLLY